METLQYLPAWIVDWSNSVSPAVARPQHRGYTSQRRLSHRRIEVVSATRRLLGSQLPYFEYFVNVVINQGQDKFIDYYADQNGLQTGTIRIKDGSYEVKTDTRTHIVTCELEIFRG